MPTPLKPSTSSSGTARPALDPRDFLAVDSLLSVEEVLIRDTVRRWVADTVEPHVGGWFRDGVFPRHLIKEMATLGLLGMHLEGYGCAGATAVEYGLAAMELEAADSGLRSFVSVQGSLAMYAIHQFGSEAQRSTWLPRMAAGDVVGCFGLTEHDAGSNPAGMRTQARQGPGGDWVLNGTKMWITNGTIADLAIVWAKDDQGLVRGFLVPTEVKGFTAHEVRDKMSLRVSHTAELVLDDVRLPTDAALPGAVSLRAPLSCLSEARYGIAWGAVGAARACYLSGLRYAAERDAFGGPLARFQLTQHRLVEMLVRLNKALLVALHLGRLKDVRGLEPPQVSFAKMDNVREALWIAREARSLLGANGISLEYAPIRHMLNLESVVTYEGTHEIHQLIIGEAITGHAAFH